MTTVLKNQGFGAQNSFSRETDISTNHMTAAPALLAVGTKNACVQSRARVVDELSQPVLGWRLNTPHIPRLLEYQSQHPKPFAPNCYTVHYPRGDAGVCGKSLQSNCGADLEGAIKSCGTSLWANQNYQAQVKKRSSRIKAGKRDRNLARNSSTMPHLRITRSRLHDCFREGLWKKPLKPRCGRNKIPTHSSPECAQTNVAQSTPLCQQCNSVPQVSTSLPAA